MGEEEKLKVGGGVTRSTRKSGQGGDTHGRSCPTDFGKGGEKLCRGGRWGGAGNE